MYACTNSPTESHRHHYYDSDYAFDGNMNSNQWTSYGFGVLTGASMTLIPCIFCLCLSYILGILTGKRLLWNYNNTKSNDCPHEMMSNLNDNDSV